MVPLIKQRQILLAVLFIATTVLAGCGKDADAPRSRSSDRTAAQVDVESKAGRVVPPKPIEEMNRAERVAFVKVLADSGEYRCCIDPGCTTCLYEADSSCRCGELVRAKDPVCGECFRGWKRGKGSVTGVDAAEVRRQ